MMDRNWEGRCFDRDCRHPPEQHLATPELATHGDDDVIWCPGCRRHEVRRAARWIFGRPRRGDRVGRFGAP